MEIVRNSADLRLDNTTKKFTEFIWTASVLFSQVIYRSKQNLLLSL